MLEIADILITNLISKQKEYEKLEVISSLILCYFTNNEEFNNYLFEKGFHKILVQKILSNNADIQSNVKLKKIILTKKCYTLIGNFCLESQKICQFYLKNDVYQTLCSYLLITNYNDFLEGIFTLAALLYKFKLVKNINMQPALLVIKKFFEKVCENNSKNLEILLILYRIRQSQQVKSEVMVQMGIIKKLFSFLKETNFKILNYCLTIINEILHESKVSINYSKELIMYIFEMNILSYLTPYLDCSLIQLKKSQNNALLKQSYLIILNLLLSEIPDIVEKVLNSVDWDRIISNIQSNSIEVLIEFFHLIRALIQFNIKFCYIQLINNLIEINAQNEDIIILQLSVLIIKDLLEKDEEKFKQIFEQRGGKAFLDNTMQCCKDWKTEQCVGQILDKYYP